MQRIKNKLFIIPMLTMLLVSSLGVTAFASEGKTVQVTGTSQIFAKPDIAKITFTVNTRNQDMSVAKTENATISNTLVNALVQNGYKKEEILTEDYYSNKVYTYQNDKRIDNGFSVTNTMKITITDFEKIGPTLDLLMDNGATEISNIDYELSNYEQLYNKALSAAIINANNKASSLFSAIGVSAYSIQTVTESGNYYKPSYSYGGSELMKSSADSVSEETTVNPHDVNVSASVTVIYGF